MSEGLSLPFPDFGWGVTQGDKGLSIPTQVRHRRRNHRSIELPAPISAKIEFYRAFLASGLSKADLAVHLGLTRTTIDRLFKLRHSSRIEHLDAAFRAVGKEMRIDVRNAA